MSANTRKAFQLNLSNERLPERKHLTIQTNLMKPVDLSAPGAVKLEVALKRCSYPKSINHPIFKPIRFQLHITYYTGFDTTIQKQDQELNIEVKDLDKEATVSGMVSRISRDATSLIQGYFMPNGEINMSLQDFYSQTMRFNLAYQRHTGRYYIEGIYGGRLEDDHSAIISKIEPNDIWRILGFVQFQKDSNIKLPVEAASAPMFDERCHLMMVVAPNLIDPQEVCGRQLPLLAAIPISQDAITSRNERATVYRRRPIYKKVRTSRIEDIRLDFLDQDLNPIPDPELHQLDVILQFRQC